MKSLLSLLVIAGTVVLTTGCSVAARSPEMYRDDTKAVLESKNNDIKACYDGILKGSPSAAGKVTVKFNVEVEAGKFTNIVIDKPNTTAPPEVAECVTKSITGLGVAPPDQRLGEATFVWEFASPSKG